MIAHISRFARRGVIALALVAGVSAPAFAGSAAVVPNEVSVPSPEATPLKVQAEGGTGRYQNYCRETGRCGNDRWRVSGFSREVDRRWRRDRNHRHWGRDWDDDRHWKRNWRKDRRWHRRNRSHANFGIYLDLAPRPYYVRPAPVYRYRLGNAHVAWCHNRWRSYRAWDNSYQPTHGPRRQCWSPYS